jgi:hypothetical protein
VGQRILASAMEAPVTVMETAGEGGAWGIALLAAYQLEENLSLSDFLEQKVFATSEGVKIPPCPTSLSILIFSFFKISIPMRIAPKALDKCRRIKLAKSSIIRYLKKHWKAHLIAAGCFLTVTIQAKISPE